MAQSGNGIDIGAVYRLLVEVAETVRAHSERFAEIDRRLDQLLDIVNDHTRRLADHARQLDDLSANVVNLRSDVGLYHEAVTSQGIHYSELEGRMLRVERHLRLEPSRE